MMYCDECASKQEYLVLTDKKEKGTCEICHRFIGPCNVMADEFLPFNQINKIGVEIGGFSIKEIGGFPIGKRVDMIDPGIPHKFVGDKKVVFQRKSSVVFGDLVTGKRIEIQF